MTRPPAIALEEVSKTFRGRIRALQGVRMQVRRGEIFGLLGPNGAGKSTLVKILMTVIRPDVCRGTLLGRPVGHQPTLARVGYLPEHHRFPEYLTGAQVMDLFGALSGVHRRTRRRRTTQLLDLVGLSPWADRRVRTYSKGMRQRLGLAQALVHEPEIVLLDEPTDGVDPVGRRDIRTLLLDLRTRGVTVFLNSHLLGELEMVCDRVAILVGGRVAAQGTLGELARGEERYEVLVEAQDHMIAQALAGIVRWDGALESPTARPGILASGTRVTLSRGTVQVASGEAAVIQPLLDALRGSGLTIRSVVPWRPTLEDLFLQTIQAPAPPSTEARES